jgi:hypothetical protein
VLEIVGEGEEHSQDEKRQTDDGDGKEIPRPVLPDAVGGVAQKIS